MPQSKTYPVSPEVAARAHLTEQQYEQMYERSISDPEAFWSEQAKRFIYWFKPGDRVLEWDYSDASIKWFEGAKLNVSYNCLDRHWETRGDKAAIIPMERMP